MIKLPEYWLQCPDVTIDQKDQAAFEQLYSDAVNQKDGFKIQYDLAAPKWKFLNYLVEEHNLVLHGSGNREITQFEPRQPEDMSEFGSQNAVYAAADGVWPMFFAVVDRETYPMTVSNACIQFVEDDTPISDSFYQFSISQGILQKKPWRKGVVYLLPSDTFAEQPKMQFEGYSIRIKQLASLVPVKPIAQLDIVPEDFPLLSKVREHDDTRMEQYARAIQTGGGWPD